MSVKFRVLWVGLMVLSLLTGLAAAAPGRPGGLKAHKYTFVGKLRDRAQWLVTVQGPDADGNDTTIQFKLDPYSKVAAGIELGDTVVVAYDFTMEDKVYEAAEVTRLPDGYKAPKSTFPDLRDPTDK